MAFRLSKRMFGEPKPITKEESFRQANRLIAIIGLISGLFAIAYSLILSVGEPAVYTDSINLWGYISSSFMLLTFVVAAIMGFDKPQLPYILLGLFLVCNFIQFVLYGYTSFYTLLLTAILCEVYHSRTIARRMLIACIICYVLAVFVGMFACTIYPSLAILYAYTGISFDFPFPFLSDFLSLLGVLLIVCFISYSMTVGGRGLLIGCEQLARQHSQIEAAAHIQQQLLPLKFDIGNDNPFDYYAAIGPIYETSGDYYDAGRIGDICFFEVADVSDKGIASAMFAMQAQSLMRGCADPGNLLESFKKVNRLLCDNNEACMFVTMLFGTLDLRTGRVAYINAGHEPLVIKQNGKVELLVPENPDPPLGLFTQAEFQVHEFTLNEGDYLFAFTDGVTDASNTSEERYGKERLVACLEQSHAITSKEVCADVFASVQEFCGELNQNDDMTMLMIRYSEEVAERTSHASAK